MSIDLNKYREYVDGFDLTEEQKMELLRTVASIMESFVDQAFGIHPVQQVSGYSSEDYLQSHMKTLDSKKSYLKDQFKDETVADIEQLN